MKFYDSHHHGDDKWLTYQDPHGTEKVFTANYNATQEAVTYLDAEVSAEMVQIIPKTFQGGKAMRLEIDACVYGCKVGILCADIRSAQWLRVVM